MRRWHWVAMIVAGCVAPAGAWHGPGHELATRAALAALDERLPAWFLEEADAVAHGSSDPDLYTRPFTGTASHRASFADHFFDTERLAEIGVTDLPEDRYGLLKRIYAAGREPRDVGFLPYSLVEWTQRLAAVFAEHRQWPDNPHIRRRALVYAGIVAHFAEDLHMPLHTTVHYDGRLKPDGNSPRSGIHLKLDALTGKLADDANDLARGLSVRPMDPNDLLGDVMDELTASHKLVDRVYELEGEIPGYGQKLIAASPAEAFARERARASARLAARALLTAWRMSASIKMPAWHQRPTAPPPETRAAAR